MNNFFKYFILLILLNNCSLDTKSGIWTDKKNITPQKNNISKIFIKDQPLEKELNPNLKIILSSKLINNSFSNNLTNNNGRVNYDGDLKKVSKFKFSKINNVKYYSSNRIASLIGNGILTFVDANTQLNDFFSDDEVIFYKNLRDLSLKINYYKENSVKRNKIAENGKNKYFRIFNNKIVAEFICSRLFNTKIKTLSWMK